MPRSGQRLYLKIAGEGSHDTQKPVCGHLAEAAANTSPETKGPFVWGLAELPVLDHALKLQILTSGDSQKRVRLQPTVAKFMYYFPARKRITWQAKSPRNFPPSVRKLEPVLPGALCVCVTIYAPSPLACVLLL